MKYILLFCVGILFLVPYNSNAQLQRHEIGLDLSSPFKQAPQFGIMYRFHKNQKALRIMAGGYFSNNNIEEDGSIHTATTSKSEKSTDQTTWRVEGRLGFQGNFWKYETWSVYGGADFCYRGNETHTEVITFLPGNFGDNRIINNTTKSRTEVGIAPLLGITWQMNERFSLSAETAVMFNRFFTRSSSTEDTYFTDNLGKETLNATEHQVKNGDGYMVNFTSANYLKVFVSFRF